MTIAKKIVNVTDLIVIEEIQDYLQDYRASVACRDLLNRPEFQEELTALVLRQLPPKYIVIEQEEVGSLDGGQFQACFTQQRSQIQEAIERGIERLLARHEYQGVCESAPFAAAGEPSAWFG